MKNMSPRETGNEALTREEIRLKEDRERKKYWKRWGPYVAERQWGTGAYPLGLQTTGAASMDL